jgi:hypothetical protein
VTWLRSDRLSDGVLLAQSFQKERSDVRPWPMTSKLGPPPSTILKFLRA